MFVHVLKLDLVLVKSIHGLILNIAVPGDVLILICEFSNVAVCSELLHNVRPRHQALV